MERKHYYAYNKTRESFLSLGVSIVDQTGGYFVTALSKRELKTNEGIWVSGPERLRTASCSGQCDRIYLDSKLCVVALMESVLGLPSEDALESSNSVLLLPVHTIFSSQTQLGDQVLIGTIEEIGAILEGIESTGSEPSTGGAKAERLAMQGPMKWLARIFAARDRRRAARHISPPIMAFYWDGGIPVPHPVPDISRTGIFVKTADRWHPRTLLRVTLQKKSDDPSQPDQTITLQCRVVRAGDDGVGMAYMLAEGADKNSLLNVGRLASRKDLKRFFDQLASEFNGSSEPEHPLLPFPDLSRPAEPSRNGNMSVHPKDVDDDVTHDSHIQ